MCVSVNVCVCSNQGSVGFQKSTWSSSVFVNFHLNAIIECVYMQVDLLRMELVYLNTKRLNIGNISG